MHQMGPEKRSEFDPGRKMTRKKICTTFIFSEKMSSIFSGFAESSKWNYEKDEEEDYRLTPLAKNLESFFQLSVGKHIQIKDSLNFLPSSLDKLVEVRRKQGKTPEKLIELFPNTWDFFKKTYPHLSDDLFQLLTHRVYTLTGKVILLE